MNQPGSPAIGYIVSVSSGNSSASNELRVTVYDSVCMECDNQGNCSQKVRFKTLIFHGNWRVSLLRNEVWGLHSGSALPCPGRERGCISVGL